VPTKVGRQASQGRRAPPVTVGGRSGDQLAEGGFEQAGHQGELRLGLGYPELRPQRGKIWQAQVERQRCERRENAEEQEPGEGEPILARLPSSSGRGGRGLDDGPSSLRAGCALSARRRLEEDPARNCCGCLHCPGAGVGRRRLVTDEAIACGLVHGRDPQDRVSGVLARGDGEREGRVAGPVQVIAVVVASFASPAPASG
jgi:hypothetical protein